MILPALVACLFVCPPSPNDTLVQSLTFNPNADPVGFATTIGLVFMPLSYAIQARFALQQKADNYKADIDEILLMRQRNSNAGDPSPPSLPGLPAKACTEVILQGAPASAHRWVHDTL